MKSLVEREKRERERQEIINKAVEVADQIIRDGSDGSTEETNFLTGEVAEIMMIKALLPFNRELVKKDLE